MTNARPEERKRKLHINYRGQKLVTAKKAMTNGSKSKFTSHCRIAAKTNFFLVLFPAHFAHARYSSWMIDRFLNWGDHGKPQSGKIRGRYQLPPLEEEFQLITVEALSDRTGGDDGDGKSMWSLGRDRQHRDGNFPPKYENEKMASFAKAHKKTELNKQSKRKKSYRGKTKEVYD